LTDVYHRTPEQGLGSGGGGSRPPARLPPRWPSRWGRVVSAAAPPDLSEGEKRDRGLRLIALFKFFKATLLIVVCLGALQLLDPDISARAQRWAAAFATSTDRRHLQHLLARVAGLSPARLELVALGAFLYAGLFTIEGIGLWLRLRWAEYLTVIATASFLPLETLEVAQHVTLPRVTALTANLMVVAYLIYRLRRARAEDHA
jgi:uncharacterized membrane protein (DUF2068 family)